MGNLCSDIARKERRTLPEKLALLVLPLLLVFSGLLNTNPAAHAQMPEVTHKNAFHSIEIDGDMPNPLEEYANFNMIARYRRPDVATPGGDPNGLKVGDTFRFELPPQIDFYGDTVSADLKITRDRNGNEVDGPKYGKCEFTNRVDSGQPGHIVCTVTDTDSLVLGGFNESITGEMKLEFRAIEHQVVENFDFKVGAVVIASIPVPGGQIIKPDIVFPENPYKFGWTNPNGNIAWQIRVRDESADADGYVNLTDVMVNDQTANGFEPHLFADIPGNLHVLEYDLRQRAEGELVSQEDQGVVVPSDRIQLEVAPDKASYTLKIKADPNVQTPRGFIIRYETTPAGGEVLPGDKFKNEVTVAGVTSEGEGKYSLTGHVGAGEESRTRFSVTKDIQGPAVATVPADTTFEVEYTVTYEEGGVQKMTTGL